MGLIPVGIHENLIVSEKSKLSDKGGMDLVVKTVESPEAILAALTNNEVYSAMESNFKFFAINLTDFNKNVKGAADLVKDLTVLRHQLSSIASVYGTKEEVDKAIGGMAMFEGLGIQPEDYGKAVAQLVQADFLKKVQDNLSSKFLAFMKAKSAFEGAPFRAKFPRGSKNKTFSGITKSPYDVWIESMSIPKAQSKIEWSDYEIKEGLNHGNPIASDASKASVEDVNKAKNLFNKPDAAATEAAAPAAEAPSKPDLFKKKATAE